MATNLISLAMQYLTPDVISRIASVLGLDRNSTQSAISAAVPALLAGFSGAATKPGGAQNLVDTIRQQPGVLDNFANVIASGDQSSLLDQGSTLLKSVLGGQDQSALAGAVSKFAGIGQGTSNSLLAMLAPVAIGAIGKQLGRNLDVGSLTGLLASQKDQIAQALPGGFGKLLAGTGLLDSLGGATSSVGAMAGQATRAAGAAAGHAEQFGASAARMAGNAGQRVAGAATSAIPTWTYWVIPLLAIGGILWYLMANRTEQVPIQPTATATQSVVVGGVDIGKRLSDSIGSLRTSLLGITDVASAKAALPRVQAVTAQVEEINGMLGRLSSDQRKVIADMTAPADATLNQLVNKVTAIPGVAEVLKPATDRLRTRLADLAAQSTTVGSGRQ